MLTKYTASALLALFVSPAFGADYVVVNNTPSTTKIVVVNKTCPCPTGPCTCDKASCTCDGCKVAAPVTTYPQYLVNGRWVSETEFRKAFPAASGVAATSPFGQAAGCAGGRCTILTTPATGVVDPTTPLTYSLDSSPTGSTSTGAPVVIRGATSGCPNGNCPAPTTYYRRGR